MPSLPSSLTSPVAPPAFLRPLFRVGGSLVAGGMLLMGTTQAATQLAHEEETVVSVLDDVSDLRVLDISNSAGAVHVVGTDERTATVTAQVSDGLRETTHGHHLDGDRLVVRGSCPIFGSSFCEVTYTVEVPARMAVRVRAADHVTVSDVDGNVDLDTDHGVIEAIRIGGNARIRSDNGRVTGVDLRSDTAVADSDNGRVELTFATSPRAVHATSDNGSVEVLVPDEPRVAYAVDATTDNGTVSDQVRQDPTSDRSITADSDNGSVTVRYPPG